MCGITGFLGLNDTNLLQAMTRMIDHRGPDDEGLFIDDHVGLGHRRLSIIDLSQSGHQPMTDASQKAVIVYNGELYNFKALRKALIDLGFHFISNSDTEVVLNAYIAWGEACLDRFNGMYAFAIWDKADRSLFMARDRLGVKPLYYTQKNNTLLFASEIKSLLCWQGLERRVNVRALDYFLTFRYNHLDETLFQNIYKLPPGFSIRARLDGNGRLRFTRNKYWHVQPGTLSIPKKDIELQLAEHIKNAVDSQMVSDVPLGAFLSSGVDSSTIAGIMKNHLKRTTNTFTVGFDYPGFEDELDPVRYTTGYLGTNHTEYTCKPEMVSVLPQVIWNTDELNADPALIPTYLISEIARKTVKVVLSGEGSDELFGGYERTMFLMYARQFHKISPAMTNMIPFFIGLVPFTILDKWFKYSSSIGHKGLDRLSNFCRNIPNIGNSYLDVAGVFTHEEKQALYGSALQQQLVAEDIGDTLQRDYFPSNIQDRDDLFYRLADFELKTRLPNDLLAKVDTMTMAHSLEARVPYLDHELVEFAFSIPSALKIRRLKEKYILRKAALHYLPHEIVNRKKDHFFVPIHLWLNNELRPVLELILTKDNIARTGFLNAHFVSHVYENYQRGALFYARQLWNILVFLIWHKMYIETDTFLTMKTDPVSLEQLYRKRGD